MVILMDISIKLLTLLAIICIIASAGAVCAADVNDGGYSGSQYQDDGGWAGSQYQDDGGYAGSQYQYGGGYAGSQYQDDGGWAGSQYQDDGGWAGSQYNASVENAAGHPVTVSAANQVVNNTTDNTTSNPIMHPTGNPILALLAVSAVLGGYAVIRRK